MILDNSSYLEGPLMGEITEYVIENKYYSEIESKIYTAISTAHSNGEYSITLDKSYRKYYKYIKRTFKHNLCYKVTREADSYCLGSLIYTGQITIDWHKSIYRRLKLKWKRYMKRLMESQ